MADVAQAGPEEALALVEAGAYLLDVREDDEWIAGHAPQAVHLPMSALSERAGEVPSGRTVVCACRSGARSQAVAQALVGAGWDAVNLAGGMQSWAAAGLPVVAEGGGPGTVI
ncbi:MAG TPA: rhodanese-like domain-containing protein [Acidimicrobiales bacterium]|nr:rhodanese-like domain-containing protein [Acidimicrobiales bacterium]